MAFVASSEATFQFRVGTSGSFTEFGEDEGLAGVRYLDPQEVRQRAEAGGYINATRIGRKNRGAVEFTVDDTAETHAFFDGVANNARRGTYRVTRNSKTLESDIVYTLAHNTSPATGRTYRVTAVFDGSARVV